MFGNLCGTPPPQTLWIRHLGTSDVGPVDYSALLTAQVYVPGAGVGGHLYPTPSVGDMLSIKLGNTKRKYVCILDELCQG